MLTLVAAFAAMLWLQRSTISSGLGEVPRLSGLALGLLAVLAVAERVSRAELMRRSVGGLSLGTAFVVHDAGVAASNGLPAGGAVSAGVRYSVTRRAGVPTADFLAGGVTHGAAITAAAWLLPFAVLTVNVASGGTTRWDVALMALCAGVLGGAALVFGVALRSDQLAERCCASVARVHRRLARRSGRLAALDPVGHLRAVRDGLRRRSRGVLALLAVAVLTQLSAALVLLVALRGLGVGNELGLLEFARVFYVTRVLSAFAPTPGGVGVVEAGLVGALAAAGVDTSSAVAGVVVFRLVTFVLPIVTGAVAFACWQRRGRTLELQVLEPARTVGVRHRGGLDRAKVQVSGGSAESGVWHRTPDHDPWCQTPDGRWGAAVSDTEWGVTSIGRSWGMRRRRSSARSMRCASRDSPPSTRSPT